MFSLQREINRLFNEIFQRFPHRTEWGKEWSPEADISETKDGYILRAELPGMKQGDVKINLNNNVLTVQGEKKQKKEEKEENYFYSEISYGNFIRSFTLPGNVKAEQVKASFKDGILEVRLPKSEEAKGKEITIETK